jgi:hypothetical protein
MLAAAGTASAAKAPRDFFGVAPQTHLTPEDFERMGEAKVGTIRLEINWASVDPTPGADYNLGAIDALVREGAERNVRVLPYFFATPEWVAKLDGNPCNNGCGIDAPKGPQALEAWKTFLRDMVARYGPGGEFWAENPDLPEKPFEAYQIWNEQNSDGFYGPKPNVKKYAKLLSAANDAIGEVDPTADVIVGGMFGTPRHGAPPSITAWDFIAKLYKIKGARNDFDGVGLHPYGSSMRKVIYQVDNFRAEIEKARDNSVDLWITEIGWASSGVTDPLVRGAKGQAKRLKEAFNYFLDNRREFNVKAVVWYSWRDRVDPEDTPCTWCAGSGLVTNNLKPKPALRAYTKFSGGR